MALNDASFDCRPASSESKFNLYTTVIFFSSTIVPGVMCTSCVFLAHLLYKHAIKQ